MATTVQISSYAPSRWPAYSPIPVIVSTATGSAGECSFRYLLEVYVSEDNHTGNPSPTWTKVATLRQLPDPDNAAVFDVSPIVQSYVHHLALPETVEAVGRNAGGGMYVWVRVDAGCEYDDTSVDCTAPSTQFLAQDTYQFIAWNAGLPYERPNVGFFPEFEFEMSTNTSNKRRFLTNHPSTGVPVGEGQPYVLSFHNFDNVTPSDITVETYSSSGTFVDVYSYEFVAVTTPGPGYDVLLVGAGPWNLNAMSQSEIAADIILPTTAYYKVYLRNGAGNRISEEIRFNLDRSCPVGTDEFQLCWVNPWGGLDSMVFKGLSSRSVSSKRASYERFPYANLGGGFSHLLNGATGGDRGRTVLSTSARDRWKFSTGFVSDDVGRWLEDLFLSPVVFMVRRDLPGYTPVALLPVRVVTSTYEEKRSADLRRLISYQIEVEADYDKNHLQRG